MKVLVLYYSLFSHIAIMAQSVNANVREVPVVAVTVTRVTELISEEKIEQIGGR
ncbi:MAG: hypothetical protein SFV81_12965 [Pirellulaceae bacterium]|nr:hypothetical protein [Pirellulaceae bacterium]